MLLINTGADYADEFKYPIISIFSSALRNYLMLKGFHYLEDGNFNDIYFGTNEYIEFSLRDVKELIAGAKEIADDDQPLIKRELSKVPSIDIINYTIDALIERLESGFAEDKEELKNLETILEKHEGWRL